MIPDTDTVPIGGNVEHSRGPDGSIFVADVDRQRIIVLEPKGQLRMRIGKNGSGPGEFRGVGRVTVLPGDTLFAVIDPGLQRLSVFRVESGQFVRSMPSPARRMGQTWNVRGDTIAMGMMFESHVFARWVVSDSTMTVHGETPKRMLANPFAYLSHGAAEVLVVDTMIVALLPTEPGLSLMSATGAFTGFVRVPAARRAGPPDDLFEIMKREERPKGEGPVRQIVRSAVFGLNRRSDGNFQLVHIDASVGADRAGANPQMSLDTVHVWTSLVSPDFQRACVDAEIPVRTIDVPFVNLRGDTVDVMVRALAGDAVKTTIESFVVATDGCEWLPTGGVIAPRP